MSRIALGETAIDVFEIAPSLHGEEHFPDLFIGYNEIQRPLHGPSLSSLGRNCCSILDGFGKHCRAAEASLGRVLS